VRHGDPHTYLHYLIRFHLKDVPDQETDRKLAAIDKKVIEMDEKIGELGGFLERIEQKLDRLNTGSRLHVDNDGT
jgi:hypothetical protein